MVFNSTSWGCSVCLLRMKPESRHLNNNVMSFKLNHSNFYKTHNCTETFVTTCWYRLTSASESYDKYTDQFAMAQAIFIFRTRL